MERENRRIQMSKRMLKEALAELLSQKNIYNISVRELCETADINRTTFYKYYGSQFDVLTDMENDIIFFIEKAIEKNPHNIEDMVKVVCEYIEANLDICRLLLNNHIDPAFAEKIFNLEIIKESFQEHFPQKYTSKEMNYLFEYIVHGALRVIYMWMNKEVRESPDELAKIIGKIVIGM